MVQLVNKGSLACACALLGVLICSVLGFTPSSTWYTWTLREVATSVTLEITWTLKQDTNCFSNRTGCSTASYKDEIPTAQASSEANSGDALVAYTALSSSGASITGLLVTSLLFSVVGCLLHAMMAFGLRRPGVVVSLAPYFPAIPIVFQAISVIIWVMQFPTDYYDTIYPDPAWTSSRSGGMGVGATVGGFLLAVLAQVLVKVLHPGQSAELKGGMSISPSETSNVPSRTGAPASLAMSTLVISGERRDSSVTSADSTATQDGPSGQFDTLLSPQAPYPGRPALSSPRSSREYTGGSGHGPLVTSSGERMIREEMSDILGASVSDDSPGEGGLRSRETSFYLARQNVIAAIGSAPGTPSPPSGDGGGGGGGSGGNILDNNGAGDGQRPQYVRSLSDSDMQLEYVEPPAPRPSGVPLLKPSGPLGLSGGGLPGLRSPGPITYDKSPETMRRNLTTSLHGIQAPPTYIRRGGTADSPNGFASLRLSATGSDRDAPS